MSIKSNIQNRVRTTPWLGRLALRAIPDLRWRVSIEPVGKFEIRLRRHRSYWLRSPLTNDGFMLGALRRLVHSNDVVYDIGANIGLYSRFLVQEFHASKVYAFEPMSGNRPQLIRNMQIGGCADRVTVLPLAIGEEDGAADFQVDDITSVTGVLDAVTHGDACESRRQYHLPPIRETVQVGRLDTVVRSQSLQPPDVMKIDVEGAEAMVLRGGLKLLREQRPDLVMELHGAAVAVEVLQILWDCNYHCFGYLDTPGGTSYKKLSVSDLPSITSKYSLHFLAASCHEEELTARIENPEWS